MSTDEGKTWPPLLAPLLIMAVLSGLPWAIKIVSAPELGAPCGQGFDCAPLRGRCMPGETGSYCTVTCERDDQCPATAHCGVPMHDAAWRWFSLGPLADRFCVPGAEPSAAEREILDARSGDVTPEQLHGPQRKRGEGPGNNMRH